MIKRRIQNIFQILKILLQSRSLRKIYINYLIKYLKIKIVRNIFLINIFIFILVFLNFFFQVFNEIKLYINKKKDLSKILILFFLMLCYSKLISYLKYLVIVLTYKVFFSSGLLIYKKQFMSYYFLVFNAFKTYIKEYKLFIKVLMLKLFIKYYLELYVFLNTFNSFLKYFLFFYFEKRHLRKLKLSYNTVQYKLFYQGSRLSSFLVDLIQEIFQIFKDIKKKNQKKISITSTLKLLDINSYIISTHSLLNSSKVYNFQDYEKWVIDILLDIVKTLDTYNFFENIALSITIKKLNIL